MFNKKLIELRKNLKLSQYELADRLGFSRGKLANYEQGTRQPDFDTLEKIADFFGVSTDYLLGREDSQINQETGNSPTVLGKRLRSLRKEKNLSQKELAERIGVSNVVLSRYELDDRKPDFDTLEKIADFFNVTIDYLLGRSDIKNPEEITYAGIKNDEYAALTPYQKEVMDFFMQSESLSFHDKPENLLDALEEFEIFYEMLKKREERKK